MSRSNFYILFIFILLLQNACKKEILVFDAQPNEELEMPLLLDINKKACFLDAPSNTFRYSIDLGSSTTFSAYVEFQDYSEVTFNGIVLQNNTTNSFGTITTNKSYALDFKTNGDVHHFNIIFTTIPTVQIVTLDKITKEPKVLAKVIVNYPELNKPSANSYIGIETRGLTSGLLKKKSYGFAPLNSQNTTDKTTRGFFDLAPNSKWVLNAMFRDFSMVRNKVSFDLWKNLSGSSDHSGIDTRLVEVFLNHSSLGLFHFHQAYAPEVLALNSQSILHKGTEVSLQTRFYEISDKAPTRFWNDWEQIYPNPTEQLNWSSFQELYNLIVTSSNSEIANNIGEILDLDQVIDYFLLIQIIEGGDNLAKNWFFMKRSPEQPFKIVPWDMDATWGRNHRGDPTVEHGMPSNGLFLKLFEANPNDFTNKLKARWSQLRLNEFSATNLKALFETNLVALENSGVISVENQVWDKDVDLAAERIFIYNWIDARLSYLDQIIPGL